MASFTWQDGTLVSKAKVEINGTIYEVDPEEYSGATPLSASNLNAMQDGIYEDIEEIEGKIENMTIYSAQEKIIGKWIDGKPIYRKTINLGNLASGTGTKSYAHGISDINNFINIYGIVNNGNEWFPFNSVYRGASSFDYDLGLLANRTSIIYSTRTDRSSYTGVVILEYTKTTD